MAAVYEGREPYIFVSYSHKNADRVKPLIAQMQRRGCRVWYDTGIQGGKEWPAVIAEHIKNCSCFMLFLTPDYVQSHNCRQEIHYALKTQREILPIYLSEVELGHGLDMQLSPIHALHFEHESRSENILRGIFNVSAVRACGCDGIVPPEEKPAEKKEKPFAPILRVACAVLLIPVLLLLATLLPEGEVSETAPPESIANLNLREETMLMPVEVSLGTEIEGAFAFQTSARRKEIQTVTFLDTLADAPADAVDVSLRQNGKVKAWIVPNGELYDMYIAAEGGVYAPENAANLFAGMTNLTAINFGEAFHTETAVTMESMFYRCLDLQELDLRCFDTGLVTDMSQMFYYCEALTQLDVSTLNTANVTDMSKMFAYCHVTELDLSKFNTANVVDMSGMFKYCTQLTELELGDFETAQVTNMRSMFDYCSHLTKLDLSSFNTEQVTDMGIMFFNCASLTELNLSSFNTERVTDMGDMFYGCFKLKQLDLSGFNTWNVTNMSYMFYKCGAAENLDLSKFVFQDDVRYESFMSEGVLVDGEPWENLFAS